ncbi:9834_t:CDS:2, partial [Diversispora eburnea]
MSESNQVILFEQEKTFYLHRTHDANKIGRYLDDSNVWHIVDGKKADEIDAKTILICSPMKYYYKGFDNDIRDEVSYKLIHICTNLLIDESDIEIESGEEVEYFNEEPYTLKTITFASDYVGEKVSEKLKTLIFDRLHTEFELSLTEEPNDSRRELTQDIKRQNEILTFFAIQIIEGEKYYRTDNKNLSSIDVIIAPDTLFQITTAMNHPINIIGLKRLYNKLAKT